MHINARSLLKNLDNFKLIMMNMQTPPSVIGVTETWLNDATSELVGILPGTILFQIIGYLNQVEESVFI